MIVAPDNHAVPVPISQRTACTNGCQRTGKVQPSFKEDYRVSLTSEFLTPLTGKLFEKKL